MSLTIWSQTGAGEKRGEKLAKRPNSNLLPWINVMMNRLLHASSFEFWDTFTLLKDFWEILWSSDESLMCLYQLPALTFLPCSYYSGTNLKLIKTCIVWTVLYEKAKFIHSSLYKGLLFFNNLELKCLLGLCGFVVSSHLAEIRVSQRLITPSSVLRGYTIHSTQ